MWQIRLHRNCYPQRAATQFIHSVEGFLAKKSSRQLFLSSCGMFFFFSWCDNCTVHAG